MIESEKDHIDLFSGIGGFSIAASWAGYTTRAFCEKDKYCRKVLERHWPAVPIIKDIRDFNGTRWRGCQLLTGGFPCQPFSQAGKQGGKEDDRYLWPEMFRIIKEAKPRFILAENVAGLIQLGLDSVLLDLASEGYSAGSIIIPACAVNAPHRRDRVWIMAHANSERGRGGECEREYATNAGEPSGSPELRNWDTEPNVGRVAHGVPDRVHRLKALGNAIVPQVAFEILNAIPTND